MQEYDGSSNSNGSTNNEVTLMSKKFKEMMDSKGKFQHSSKHKGSRFKNKNKEESNEIICFKCRKLEHMKVKCPQLKKNKYFGDKKKKISMVTWDDSDNEKSNSSSDEQAHICLLEDIDDKVDVKTCPESDTFSYASLDDEEDMPYDVFLHNYDVISLVKILKKNSKLLLLKTLNKEIK